MSWTQLDHSKQQLHENMSNKDLLKSVFRRSPCSVPISLEGLLEIQENPFYLGAEYLSPKKVNLLNYNRF